MSGVGSESKAEPKQEEAEEVKGGELLFCGCTSWDIVGRHKGFKDGNLVSPTRLRSLIGVDIRFVASGCSSCHCVALDVGGRCYSWGRNEKGQLGHGDTIQRDRPTVIWGLSKYKVVKAGTGRSHSVVASEDGQSFSFGWNKHGQLGSGSVKNAIEASPVRCLVSGVKHTTCGADFTVWLTSTEGASILYGLPQYGQLGHGTNNEYNSKDSSVRLVYEPQPHPRAIATLSRVTIIKVACGTNHTVAVDSDGFVYTWGFGGYGRLGHREQKDEWAPRRVEVFQNKNVLPPDAVISAGSLNSACTAGGGQLYIWGKIKISGDDWMYPKPLLDLSGWNIRCMDSGNMHYFVGADSSCISWGHAQYGELGYGPNGQKSSSVPKKVDVLDGMHVISVACGMGHSMVVVDRKDVADRLELLNVYDGKASDQAIEPDSNNAVDKPTSKKGNRVPVNSKRKKSKRLSESEDEEGGDQESDGSEEEADDKNPRARKASGVGRGKAPRSSASVGKVTGRGRGHPPSAGERSKSSQPKTGKRGRPRKRID